MGREYERKYRCGPQAMEAIRERYGPFAAIAMETAYFDTPGRALTRRRWTLRRRLENGRCLCALKTPGEGGYRGEWELEQRDLLRAVPELWKLGAPEELLRLAREGLEQVCAARFTRLAAVVALEGAVVELALDQGQLLGGGRALPFAEAEVELKEGSQEAADAFAQALAAEFGLTPEPRSKAQRAMALGEMGTGGR